MIFGFREVPIALSPTQPRTPFVLGGFQLIGVPLGRFPCVPRCLLEVFSYFPTWRRDPSRGSSLWRICATLSPPRIVYLDVSRLACSLASVTRRAQPIKARWRNPVIFEDNAFVERFRSDLSVNSVSVDLIIRWRYRVYTSGSVVMY